MRKNWGFKNRIILITLMKIERFRLALRELKSSDWERFEQLASVFLSAEFDEIRTLAAASGDGGRDAVLFTPTKAPSVALQYSVADDWIAKIRRTALRLKEKFPGQITVLIYVTNQRIGAEADPLRTELLTKHSLHLDVRDLSWFLERVNADRRRQEAAEGLAEVIADPFLASEGVFTDKPRALSGAEARAALLYLALQWEDDTREKGLSRLSFEALIRAALRGTDSSHRLSRAQVSERVLSMVPNQQQSNVTQHVDSALQRLTKKVVRHWTKEDEFCLTFDEQQRLITRLAELEIADERFKAELEETLISQAQIDKLDISAQLPRLLERTRSLIDAVLFDRGEMFAQAVLTGDLRKLDMGNLRDLVIADIAKNGDEKLGAGIVDFFTTTIEQVIISGGEGTQIYLRRFSDSYTLFAFLRETPEVQEAVNKMFSHGEIWLDAIVVLPLFAETLLEDEEQRRFTKLIRAASGSGLSLHITSGVIEEIERHFNRCITCLSNSAWQGRTPFILAAYASSGRSLDRFRSWLENFIGNARPADDIAQYLREEFEVTVKSLEEEMNRASVELRSSVEEIWYAAHYKRRQPSPVALDPITLHRLVAHDVENYVGVIERRNQERDSPLGYTSWWLTLDPTAFAVRGVLSDRLVGRVPDSPVISPDFFANYLAFGPTRQRLGKATERQLPISFSLGLFEAPMDILATATRVREEATNLPEHVIARRVRDALDAAKRRPGVVQREGIAGMEHKIKEQLKASATKALIPDSVPARRSS